MNSTAEADHSAERQAAAFQPVAVRCPACSGTDRHWLFRKNGCDVYRCAVCGLGRAEPAQFDPERYYSADYFSGGHQDGYSDYVGAEAVLRREFAGTVEWIRGLKSGGRLLEIGCAYGFFLDEAKRYFDVAGIELAEQAAAYCRRKGLDVLSGPADQAHLDALGPADVIVLLDVIEHLPDPQETLRQCSAQLKPGGIVVLTTGDFDSPPARIMKSGWRLMTPPQHLWYFTADSLRRIAGAAGLTVERVDHPWKRVPLSLVLFQVKRMLGMSRRPISFGGSIGVPINLFDAMRVVLRKP